MARILLSAAPHQASILLLRARLEATLHNASAARKDAAASYSLLPNVAAAEKLGEFDELDKNYPSAIVNYARAFSLFDPATKLERRRELRQKLANVWRLAHGSDAGLGDYLLATFDEVSSSPAPAKQKRNASAKNALDFVLRKTPSGGDFPLAAQKGKVLVVNFWATWCGPCRAQEPLYEKVAAEFAADPNVLFLAADCDDDESLVPPYLEEVKPRTTVVFADGLDNFFRIEAFPTVLVLDRSGKISFRYDGLGDFAFIGQLSSAVHEALSSPAR
jgi:thiol-disulfide isomerase/thioredoxin